LYGNRRLTALAGVDAV